MIDEGPSSEDIERFSDDTGHCPHCGAEIWDQADVCPRCRNYIGGDTLSRHPVEQWWRQKWWAVFVVLVLIGLLGFLGIRIL